MLLIESRAKRVAWKVRRQYGSLNGPGSCVINRPLIHLHASGENGRRRGLAASYFVRMIPTALPP